MKRLMVVIIIALALAATACSTTESRIENDSELGKHKEAIDDKENESSDGDQQQDVGESVQEIDYHTISLEIPGNWKYKENEDDSIVIYRSIGSNFYCALDSYNISENVDVNTTEDDIYSICEQMLQDENGEMNFEVENGHFANCPAVFFTRHSEDADGIECEYKGLIFAADINMYMFFYTSAVNEDHEKEKEVAEQIIDSITISSDVNTGVYNQPSNNESSQGQEEEGWIDKTDYKIRIKDFSYEEDLGNDSYYSYIIEIINTSDDNLALTKCTVDVEDSKGNLVGLGDSDSMAAPPIIRPGELGYYYGYAHVTNADASKEYKLIANEIVNPTNVNPVECEVSDTSLNDDYGMPRVIGRVTNNSGLYLPYLFIHVVFYNENGEVIGLAITGTGELNDGESQNFECEHLFLNTSEIADYKVIAVYG